MSGGSLDYISYKMNDVLFPAANVHYSNILNKKEYAYARDENPMEDKDVSELVFDVACLLHSLEWYKSGDNREEHYKNDLEIFKNKWFNTSAR